MFDAAGNAPTVARLLFVLLGADGEAYSATDQVAGLLMRVGVPGQDSVFA